MKKLVFLFAILYMCISIPQISFAQETGWSMPFGTGPGSAYNIGGGAFRGDSSYTVFDIPSDDAFYYSFTDINVSPNKILAIPPEKVIKGIEVSLRGFRTESSDFQFMVNLKGNGTANWTEGKTTTGLIFNSTSPKTSTTQVLGSPTDNWGLWSYSQLEGSAFLVKVSVSGTTGDAWLDGVLVKVYYGDPVLPFIVNTTGKFKVPADITSLTAKVWGGGGGGAKTGFNGLGGGGGGFGTGTFNITSGELIDITVGTGGLGAIGSRLNGYDGNLSKVMWSTGSITASAGRGGGFDGGISPGTGGTGSSTGTVTNTSFFFGGNGASGSSGNGGGGGGGAGDHANGTYASGTSGGSGGNQSGGNGGNGSTDTNVGGNGQSYSGGGGGGSTLGLYGGNGADGAVIISLPVLGYPAPTIVGPEIVCAYSPFTLTANGESGATYSWSGPLGFTSTDQNPQITINSTVIPSPINFTYYVTQTVNGSISDPASITVAVYNKPNPGLFVYTARDVCEGTQYTVEFNVMPEPGGIWSSTDPTIAAVDNNGVVTGISLGTTTISYTVTNSVGCTASRSIEITVTPFNAEITGNNGPIIYGGTAEFYLTGTPEAILTYLINGQTDNTQQYWFDSKGNLTLAFPNVTVDQTLTLVSLSRPNICSKTLTGTSTVTVNPLPPCSNPSIQLGTAVPACFGSYGAYLPYSNLTNYEGSSRLIVNWDSPDMLAVDDLLKNYLDFPEAGFLYLPLDTILAPGTYSGTLKIQTRDCTSEEYPFEIAINTPLSVPEASNSGPVCAGSTFILTANGEDGATYIWYTDWGGEFWYVETYDKSIEIQTDETWVGDFTYGLVQYVGGCYSETATTTVTVNPLPCCPNPPAIALGTAEPVCSEQVWIVLPYSDLMNFNPADGNLLITWDSPDLVESNYNGPANEKFVNISGVGLCIAIHIPDVASGTYTGTIILTNFEGCSSTTYPFSATIKEPLPKPTIEVIDGSTQICDEGSVTLQGVGIEVEGTSYKWYLSGIVISRDQNLTYHFYTPSYDSEDYIFEVSQTFRDELGNDLCESERTSIIVTHSRKPYGGYIQTSDKMCTGTTKSVTWFQNPDQGGTYQSSNTDVATVDQDGLVSALSAGSAEISYSLTGTGACSSDTVKSTETFDVYDNYAEITGNNGPICTGGTAVFYINAPAERLLEYKLNDAVQPIIGTNQIIADGGLKVEGITASVTLTLTAVKFDVYCTKVLDQSSTVDVNPIPVTFVSPQTSEITEGASVTLTASGADSYSWSSVPAGFSSTDAAVSVTPLKNTTYIVTGTSSGCSSSDDAIIYVRETCKNSADQYEPNNSMSGTLFSIPIDLTISANLLNAKDPDWYRLDISSPAKYTLKLTKTGTVSPSVDLYGSNGRKLKSIDRTQPNSYNLSSGTYYIKVSAVTKTYLCYTLQVVNEGVAGALASFDDTKSAKIIEPISDGIIKIWPNPTKNEFELYNGHENPVQVRVMDVIGRTIETIENVGISETIVFGSKYKPGIYFIETFGNGVQKVFKLVKQ